LSLLGRLEDLSLTDIIQIVFLSRRTGILEIIDHRGRFTVLFRHGLIVSASSPESPTLVSWLELSGLIPPDAARLVAQTEDAGVPAGSAVIDLNLLSREQLIEAIQQRLTAIINPLLASKEGEFNFILSDSINELDIEYDVDQLFSEGGMTPQQILQTEGEKLKPLRGLEESMRVGKELLRSAASGVMPPPSLDVGFGAEGAHEVEDEDEEEEPTEGAEPFEEPAAEAEPFGAGFDELDEGKGLESLLGTSPAPEPETEAIPEAPAEAHRPASARTEFRVGSNADVAGEARARDVVVLERDPLVRVAVKRAFARKGIQIHQFGAIDDARRTVYGLLRENHFFVTFLDLDDANSADPIHLLDAIKKKNHKLPVVVVDREADLRRRHDLLKHGVDLYLTKPSGAHLQPGLAEQQLTLYADELVVFTDRTFDDWEQAVSGYDRAEAGKRFYEAAEKEKVSRSFTVLRNLINELTNPDDIRQVTDTILRMSAEYVDRGVLFVSMPREFVALGGFGDAGDGGDINQRARAIRIAKGESSILDEVEANKTRHHGKIPRTAGNRRLMEHLGPLLPSDLLVVPLVHQERVIGMLYADNAVNRVAIDNYAGLEIFLSQAGLAFDSALVAAARRHTIEQEKR
jgi:CheY-like chemotaxis protein